MRKIKEKMKSYKKLLNSLSDDKSLRQLTNEEITKLKKVLLIAFQDITACCEKHNLTIMLIGGTAIGAVRHQGFIPWDDDLDVAMPRKDFENLKRIFESELGDKYILSSPNYKNNANNRFPMILIKNTLLVEAGNDIKDEGSKIKIDIFIIENIPESIVYRYLKGFWCTCLMFITSYEETYEKQNEALKKYMYKTKEGCNAYKRRIYIGRLFSFFKFQKWVNITDKACQYNKETSLMGIPSGRGHYFGEIRPRITFLPTSKGTFEGLIINLPGNPDDYISNLYGTDYMTLPPIDKRERHFILDIKFKEDK